MTRFGELPEMLKPEYEVSLYEFQYFHEDRAFVIGNKSCGISESEVQNELNFPSGEPVKQESIATTPVGLDGWGHPVTSPRFYTWLMNVDRPSMFQETSDVMRKAYEELGNISLQKKHNKEMHPMGFSAGLLREGHINLSVLGNCACLGTNPDGHIVDYDEWDTGFAEMTLHNIDTSVQHISIMAGLGHMAVRCVQET